MSSDSEPGRSRWRVMRAARGAASPSCTSLQSSAARGLALLAARALGARDGPSAPADAAPDAGRSRDVDVVFVLDTFESDDVALIALARFRSRGPTSRSADGLLDTECRYARR